MDLSESLKGPSGNAMIQIFYPCQMYVLGLPLPRRKEPAWLWWRWCVRTWAMYLVMSGEVEICFSMCMRKRTQQRMTAQPSDGSRGPWAAASAGPGAGAGLRRLEVRDQIRRCRHTCCPAALAQSGHGGGGARGLRGV
jgi:hypothetical protein